MAFQERWLIMAEMRLNPQAAEHLDAMDVWNACHRPWMGWYKADQHGMIHAIDAESRRQDSTIRLGAYELVSEWFGEQLLDYEDGRALFVDAMATLKRAGLGREHIRMFELGAGGLDAGPLSTPAPTTVSAVTRSTGEEVPEEAVQRLACHLAAACEDVWRKYRACYDERIQARRAQAAAAQQENSASERNFRALAHDSEREFIGLLEELRASQLSARALWQDFVFMSGAPEGRVSEVLVSLQYAGTITIEEVTNIMVHGIVAKVDFGSTMESFAEADARTADLMNQMHNG